ncbi:MAG TPA: T9SS type A sorting domain-containing protein, partial [Bacteroidales bacterium]|nr:T9SS type A sorting domain-containing protein [Bacteroidales bacterium]
QTTGVCGNVSACATVTVTVNTLSTAPTSASASPSTICAGNSSTLSYSGGSLGTGAVAKWYSGSCGGTLVGTGNNISVSPSSTTTYYVRFEGTCNTTSCVSVTVTVNTLSTAPTSASASPSTICAGNSSTLSYSGGSLGTGAVAKWYSGSCGGTLVGTGNNISVSPSSTTTYYVRFEGTCNTTSCASVNVTVNPLPSATASSNSPVCQGNTINLTSGPNGMNYSWSGPNSFSSTSQNPSITNASSSNAGNYTVTVTNPATGCSATATTNVTVNPLPSATASSNSPVCQGNTINLTSGPNGMNYSWSGPNSFSSTSQNPSITNASSSNAGNYTVTVTNSTTGCSTTATTNVTVNTNPIPNISPATINICVGQSTTITASGGTNYSWNTGSINSTITVSPSTTTTYTVTVTNAVGCTSSINSVINVTVPNIANIQGNDYVWAGYANQNWENPANWILYNGLDYIPVSTIPSVSDNVHIIDFSSCVANQSNVLSSSNVYCHDINIYSSLTLQNNSNLNVKGNFNNQGTLNIMNSSVTFSGSSAQNVRSGTANFYNVIFNNSHNGNADITLLDDMRVNNSATFTNGIVNTGSNKFILNSGASVNIGTSTSFVDGTIQVTNSGMMTLPTGHVNTRNIGAGNQNYKIWAPIGINPVASTTTTVRYFFDNTGMPDWWEHGGNMDATLHHVSDREYWLVNSTENFVNVTLYWRNNNHPNGAVCVHSFCEGDNVFYQADLSVAYWSGTLWRDAGGSVSGNHDNGNITSALQIPLGAKAQTYITFGSKQNQNPLPVELVKFYAICNKYSAELLWETASETNNDYFIIEKSRDMQNFHVAGIVKGSGTSNQTNSYKLKVNELFRGDNYFRLKQVDFDGKVNEYNTIVVNCDKSDLGSPSMIVYPNPFNNEVNVVIENITDNEFSLEIFDESGRSVFSNTYQSERMDVHKSLNLDYLAPAVYNIRMKSQNHVLNTKIIKK